MAFWSNRQVPIGVKIFGTAASMLGLLLIVVAVSSNRLRQVSQEIEFLAEYIIPITDAVATVDVHALEQEVLFERILKHYEIEPIDREKIAEEIGEFEQRNHDVDAELRAIQDFAEKAIAYGTETPNALMTVDADQQLARLISRLESVEHMHQKFHDHAVHVLDLLDRGQFIEARQLVQGLAAEEEEFDRSIEEILIELEAVTVEAAQTGQSHQAIVQHLSLSIALLATVFGGTCAWLVTLGIVRPVQQLTQKMQTIQQGDFSAQATISSHDEIATLATTFNHMVNELKSKAQLEETFGKYVDPRVVKQLLISAEETSTMGDRQVMTVFFADVEGFGAAVEVLPPDELVAMTNHYFAAMARPISNQSGVIDKFINTTVMGFWGPPFANTLDHAALACETALEQQGQLTQITQQLQSKLSSDQPIPSLRLRVGIATGSLVVGNMGSAMAKSYTVMGDTVNIASRLKGVSKQYGVAITLTQDTQTIISEHYATRELDLIQVVGKDEPVCVYELLGPQTHLDDATRQRQEQFAKGLAAYRQRNWETAYRHFEACSTPDRPDPPALLYLSRIETLRDHPPPEDWDGVWQMTKK